MQSALWPGDMAAGLFCFCLMPSHTNPYAGTINFRIRKSADGSRYVKRELRSSPETNFRLCSWKAWTSLIFCNWLMWWTKARTKQDSSHDTRPQGTLTVAEPVGLSKKFSLTNSSGTHFRLIPKSSYLFCKDSTVDMLGWPKLACWELQCGDNISIIRDLFCLVDPKVRSIFCQGPFFSSGWLRLIPSCRDPWQQSVRELSWPRPDNLQLCSFSIRHDLPPSSMRTENDAVVSTRQQWEVVK